MSSVESGSIRTGQSRQRADDSARLREVVESLVDSGAGVRTIERRANPFASRVPSEVLTISLHDGTALEVFLKSSGEEESDHPDKQVRDREALVYESLLLDESLPVPRFYGRTWNESSERRELFIEYIDDWDLRYQDLDRWYEAARNVGRLHAYFASRRHMLESDFLNRFGRDYFVQWAHRAAATIRTQHPTLVDRLARIVDRYQPVATFLALQPTTLVHNDMGAKNIIVDRSITPGRVCIVDWEMAGAGSPVMDMATLVHGLPSHVDARMWSTYLEEVRHSDLFPGHWDQIERARDAVMVHKVFLQVWRNQVWDLPIERVQQWLEDAETRLARIGRLHAPSNFRTPAPK